VPDVREVAIEATPNAPATPALAAFPEVALMGGLGPVIGCYGGRDRIFSFFDRCFESPTRNQDATRAEETLDR
jgi:hypothetical protein